MPQSSGVTVYSECGGGDIVIAPNPATNTVMIIPAASSSAGLQGASLAADAGSSSVHSGQPALVKANSLVVPKITMVKVFGLKGILEKVVEYPAGVNQVNLDIKDLLSGEYFVQVYYVGGKFVTKKLIVQK